MYKTEAAGARGGKSMSAGYDFLPQILKRGRPFHLWIVGPTYPLAGKEFAYIASAVQTKLRVPCKYVYNPNSGDIFLGLPNGSTVTGKSAKLPKTLLGDRVDGIIMAEAAQMERWIWERILSQRVAEAGDRRKVIIPTTPYVKEAQLRARGRWIKEVFYEPGQDPKKLQFMSCNYPSIASPNYPVEYFLEQKKILPEWVFQEQYLGLFSKIGGICLERFKAAMYPEGNLLPPQRPGPEHTVVAGLDPAGGTPFGMAFLYMDSPKRVVVYDESYNIGDLIETSAGIVKEKVGNPLVWHATCDKAELWAINELSALEVICSPYEGRSVEGPITVMNSMFARKVLAVCSNCKKVIWEIENYLRREDTGEPVDKNNHLVKSIGYALGTNLLSPPVAKLRQTILADSSLRHRLIHAWGDSEAIAEIKREISPPEFWEAF